MGLPRILSKRTGRPTPPTEPREVRPEAPSAAKKRRSIVVVLVGAIFGMSRNMKLFFAHMSKKHDALLAYITFFEHFGLFLTPF